MFKISLVTFKKIFSLVPKVSPTDIKVFVHANNPRKVTLQWTKIDESKVRGRVLGYNISVVETATGGKFKLQYNKYLIKVDCQIDSC